MVIHKEKNGIVAREAKLDSPEALHNYIDDLNRFMGEFRDPSDEVIEAICVAGNGGWRIEAVDGEGIRLGVLVITPTPFEKFQPAYHLAYIATAPEARGRGVGKLLLETSAEITSGKIALHVGVDNRYAIEFYERMGWTGKYLRMMP
ncbi:MAG TPA: GNAT family N-acetyltransferase [candidate division Zixibacteria bacterium]|nr:GNAT family N-acetyltransferase [candidate division Zixibacteria bacterium]